MLNKTSYLNGLTKQKQLDINMDSLRNNLKHARSINKSSIQLERIQINRNKMKYIVDRRDHQINVQNDVLNQKIDKILARNSKYFSAQHQYSKSLNGYVKRTTQSRINEDNLKLLIRLEQSKPTYVTKRFLQEFQHIKMVEQKMSTADFYLTDSPTFRKRKLNTNRSFLSGRNSSFADNDSKLSKNDINEYIKQELTLNDGKLWEIKIIKEERFVKITGQVLMSLDEKDTTNGQVQLKLIKIPNIEANSFLRKHCENKLHNLIKHIKVDQDGSLMLIVPTNQRSVSPSKLLINPEERKVENKKLNVQSPLHNHKKTAPRQAFRNLPTKVILPQDLKKYGVNKQIGLNQALVKQIKSNQIKQSKNQKLPEIQSNKSGKKEAICSTNKVLSHKKESISSKGTQKQRNHSQIESIKSNKKSEIHIQQAKVNKQKHDLKKSEKSEIIKSIQKESKSKKSQKKSQQKQQSYEQQNFQQSGTNKVDSIKDKFVESAEQVIQQSTKQEETKPHKTENSNEIKIEEDKIQSKQDIKMQQAEQNYQEQKYQDETLQKLPLEQSHEKKNQINENNQPEPIIQNQPDMKKPQVIQQNHEQIIQASQQTPVQKLNEQAPENN